MTAIGSTSNDNPWGAMGLANQPTQRDTGLGQADFLRLMTEQLKHQDPLNPLDNTQFLGQLAQFSTVQGIGDMQLAMGSMASVMESDQALRAAALVGHDALVEVDSVALSGGGGVSGEIAAETSGPVVVEVVNEAGVTVQRLELEATGAGALEFAWDGRAADGGNAPAGNYTFRASSGAGEDTRSLQVRLAAKVESVSIEPTGLVLNLEGLGSHPLSSVRRVG
ncbi:flagellar hook assembly protein FlgD [Lysobacter sp. GX 14042]|uniref:flagellar hook assembly protein FlgD n=1 Tax=Lysobacter sp. GX 14042 TaxID=2907155 RepID=UPI001F38C250|nr:flagellar hook capping FlgD N-terminal domain-containing protein [Lysobacter sp. GX 14042]MCE7031954.1 flagellar hook assembly protein FlgD [Lysobacter sp. GX 14042]